MYYFMCFGSNSNHDILLPQQPRQEVVQAERGGRSQSILWLDVSHVSPTGETSLKSNMKKHGPSRNVAFLKGHFSSGGCDHWDFSGTGSGIIKDWDCNHCEQLII